MFLVLEIKREDRILDSGDNVDEVLEAVKGSGRQLIEQGKLTPKTLNTVSRQLLPIESYVQVVE